MSINPDDLTPGRRVWVWRPEGRCAVELTVKDLFTFTGKPRRFVSFVHGFTSETMYCFATRELLVAAIVPELQEEADGFAEQMNERLAAIDQLRAGATIAAGV